MTWETVIGLEVHVQQSTRTKMFCGCIASFGDPPNTNVCPTCLGLPGALPVPNVEAVRLAVRGALALGGTVHHESVFARKNYFYPDLPKGYQVSQFDRPLSTGGAVWFESPERGRVACSITRLHIEEDAGKSLHDRYPGHTAVDLNRAGTPLAEIVSGPDLRSPAEARAYLVALKQILVYAGVSDCSMEKGTLRVDANLSIRPAGQQALGTKTEIKNMNSFANVERALTAEYERQVALLESGGRVEQVSLLFNAANGTVRPTRSKEDSHDYRYFPDPDLPPLVLTEAFIEEQRQALPELPEARRARFEAAYGLSAYHAQELTGERAVADYFEATVQAGAEAKAVVGWVLGDAMAAYNADGRFRVSPAQLAELVAAIAGGVLSQQGAKQVFVHLLSAGPGKHSIADVAGKLGLVQVQDTGALEGWVDDVLAAHPDEVTRFRGGEAKLIGFFVGQVMKKSKGKADPKGVAPILQKKLRAG
ncbi:MAG TPA: Asp-tRNA(Asn)/Glu-tRNA(Gln) amidotransferase subunit GatB [Gemmatimonadales bacterium]|mgnify:CR=1 FL=1|nr:Asp-tRNA(Asn)/Glu-tRNA(Gln) amidotransferase subunit GatB [Gemmatimonadales bacterium]